MLQKLTNCFCMSVSLHGSIGETVPLKFSLATCKIDIKVYSMVSMVVPRSLKASNLIME